MIHITWQWFTSQWFSWHRYASFINLSFSTQVIPIGCFKMISWRPSQKKTELHASVDDARKHQKDDSTCVFHMLGTWPLQGTSKRPVKSDTRKILEHWLSGWLFGWYLLVTATQGLFIGHGWFDLHGLWDFPYLGLSWIRVPTTLQPFFQHTFKRPNRQS